MYENNINNHPFIASLSNVSSDKDKMTCGTTNAPPDYFSTPCIEDNTKSRLGPKSVAGWAGQPPYKYVGFDFYIKISSSKTTAISRILEECGFKNASKFTHHSIDNGLIYNVMDKIITETINHEMQVVKQPWFDDLLEFMRRRDSSFDEAKLMDIKKAKYANTCAVSHIIAPWVETKNIIDQNYKIIKICVANDDIPKYKNMINMVIGLILELV